jgi:predicted nuclease of predicted toxin-antitoxin system
MKFLLDQCTDAPLLTYLKQLGHDVTQIRRTYPQSIPDPEILSIAGKRSAFSLLMIGISASGYSGSSFPMLG